MWAVHGTKTKNDREDADKIARLVRGGNFPLAYVYPAEWRPTRDLLRRRGTLKRRRAELLTRPEHDYSVQSAATKPTSRTEKKKRRILSNSALKIIVPIDNGRHRIVMPHFRAYLNFGGA